MRLIANRYRLEEEIGTGASATVYRAFDAEREAYRAVKVLTLPPGRLRDLSHRRLQAEASLMRGISHANVLRIYDFGTDDGQAYIVMELAEGGSLADWLERNGPMPPRSAVKYTLEVLDGLHAAHAAGIVHRDVKPHNILLHADGSTKLCDFGIAMFASSDDRQTRTGTALGSWAFMAPEQRIDARTVGPAADIYSAACTLYNLLTTATPVDLFLAPRSSPRWEGVPEPLAPILSRATNARPSDRYPDCPAMAQSLRNCVDKIGTRPVAAAEPGDMVHHPTTLLLLEEATELGPPPAPTPVPAPQTASDKFLADLEREAAALQDKPAPPRSTRSLLWVAIGVLLIAVATINLAGPWMRAASITTEARPPSKTPPPPQVLPPNLDPAGVWRGTWVVEPATLELEGAPDSLLGTLTVHHATGAATARTVSGTFDVATRKLHLRDADPARSSGPYTARMDASGLWMNGQFHDASSNRAGSFGLVRITGWETWR